MAYEGEHLNYCPAQAFDWGHTYAVIVTGARFNPYGHMILNTGGPHGRYFQVSEVYGNPRFMDEPQFRRYLKENDKTIVSAMKIPLSNPNGAQEKLESVMGKNWMWGMVVHNCESFVEEIIVAGGGPKFHKGIFPLPMNATNMCESW